MDLYSYTKGDAANPPVILIHGLLGSSRNLYRLAETIAAAGFYVVAYDQRGHGHSSHAEDYSFDALAHDTFAVMNKHNIISAHLVGHSLGARVSLAASAREPLRVKSITMLDAGTTVSEAALKALGLIIDPLPDTFASREEAENILNATNPPGIVQFLVSNLRTVDGRQSWIFDLHGLRRRLLPQLNTDQSQAWADVRCPAMIVRGSRSEHFRQPELEAMLKLNPRAASATVPNAGHWLHVDNFMDTSQTIVNFLKSVETKSI